MAEEYAVFKIKLSFLHRRTRKFDLNELREIVVCVWQFFADHELQIAITGALHLETECFWHFVSGGGVLISLASGLGLELLPQKTIFTPKCPTMELSHIIFAEIPPSAFTPSAVFNLTYFLFCFCSPWLCLSYSFAGWNDNLVWFGF